jgi:hypothetical protein
MKRFVLKKVAAVILLAPLAFALIGYVVMALWNWLMPEIFGLQLITFWQALGLLLLSKLLFGSIRMKWGGNGFKENLQQKIDCMTPEERENFKEKMRERCKQWGSGN